MSTINHIRRAATFTFFYGWATVLFIVFLLNAVLKALSLAFPVAGMAGLGGAAVAWMHGDQVLRTFFIYADAAMTVTMPVILLTLLALHYLAYRQSRLVARVREGR